MDTKNGMRPVHPGEILREELDTLGLSANALARALASHPRVLLLDDINGWWPASGTALHLAERGHDVTVVTASDKAAEALDGSHLGPSTRERFAKLGVEVIGAHALTRWADNVATIVSLHTGDERQVEADSLVLATTNTVDDALARALADDEMEVHTAGDIIAARTASMAFYEGRTLGMTL